jgi:hypothetical protein
MSYIVYREFPDGDEEIGVLTFEDGHGWVHVGDFDYCLSLGHYAESVPFSIIGVL